jgi:predicted N-acetyltransferase YhbS
MASDDDEPVRRVRWRAFCSARLSGRDVLLLPIRETPTFEFSTEMAAESAAVESLLNQGFGPDRHARTVYRLRETPAPAALRFVARHHGGLAATLRFWPVVIGNHAPALLLGPLAVAARLRGHGIGGGPLAHGLGRVATAGWRLCLVVGKPAYYAPFGFEPAQPWGLALPGPVDVTQFQLVALGTEPLARLLPAGNRGVLPWRSHRCSAMTVIAAPPSLERIVIERNAPWRT